MTTTPSGIRSHVQYGDSTRRWKTVCTSHVLAALGIDSSEYHYSGTCEQLLTIARKRWSLRSVRSRLGFTVGGSRKAMADAAKADPSILAFVIFVHGHVILCDTEGKTQVDTAPRKRDTRSIRWAYAVRTKDWS